MSPIVGDKECRGPEEPPEDCREPLSSQEVGSGAVGPGAAGREMRFRSLPEGSDALAYIQPCRVPLAFLGHIFWGGLSQLCLALLTLSTATSVSFLLPRSSTSPLACRHPCPCPPKPQPHRVLTSGLPEKFLNSTAPPPSPQPLPTHQVLWSPPGASCPSTARTAS